MNRCHETEKTVKRGQPGVGGKAMCDSFAASPAEHILGMPKETDVHALVAELARSRQLGRVVRELNAAVLDGASEDHDRAVAALSRMGFWTE